MACFHNSRMTLTGGIENGNIMPNNQETKCASFVQTMKFAKADITEPEKRIVQ